MRIDTRGLTHTYMHAHKVKLLCGTVGSTVKSDVTKVAQALATLRLLPTVTHSCNAPFEPLTLIYTFKAIVFMHANSREGGTATRVRFSCGAIVGKDRIGG